MTGCVVLHTEFENDCYSENKPYHSDPTLCHSKPERRISKGQRISLDPSVSPKLIKRIDALSVTNIQTIFCATLRMTSAC